MCVGPPCIICQKCQDVDDIHYELRLSSKIMPWTHILMFNASIPRRAPCDWVGFMDQPWDPWVHLQRFCSPNDDVNKGQLLSLSLAFCSWGCLPSFTPGVCPTWILVGCGHATKNEWTFKSSSFLWSFRICPTQKQYQLQASWKNLGKSWTCAIYIYIYVYILCYIFLLHHCKPIERSMVFFPFSVVPNKNVLFCPHFFGDEKTRKLMPWISIDLISSDIWKDRSGDVIWRCHSLGSSPSIWVFPKIGVGYPKMDGENHGKAWLKWMIWG